MAKQTIQYDNTENDTLTAYQRDKKMMRDKYFPRDAVVYQKLWLFAMKKPIYIPVRDKGQYKGLVVKLFKCLKPVLVDKRFRWARQNLRVSLVEYGGRPCLRLGYDEMLMEVKKLLADLYRENDLKMELNPETPYEEVAHLYKNDFIPRQEVGEELQTAENKRMANERREFYRVLGIADTANIEDEDEELVARMYEDSVFSKELDEVDTELLDNAIPRDKE